MKTIWLLLFSFLSKYGQGQCPENTKFNPAIFQNELVRKSDTIYFTASFHTLGKVSQRAILKELSEKNMLDETHYKTAISFTPLNTKTKLYLPYRDQDAAMYKKLRTRQSTDCKICIRGVLLRGYTQYNDSPFFLIDQVWIEE
jgi:hypothetical protein